MATVNLTYGKGSCQHVGIIITHAGETRTYVMMMDEIKAGVALKEAQFETIKNNALTNIMLQVKSDSKVSADTIKATIEAVEFKI